MSKKKYVAWKKTAKVFEFANSIIEGDTVVIIDYEGYAYSRGNSFNIDYIAKTISSKSGGILYANIDFAESTYKDESLDSLNVQDWKVYDYENEDTYNLMSMYYCSKE